MMQRARTLLATLALSVTPLLAANFGAGAIPPDVTIPVSLGNMQGWTLTWEGYGTSPGGLGGFAAFEDTATAPAGTETDNGAWHQSTVWDWNVGSADWWELRYTGIAGTKVSDWHGFEYRSYQLAPASSHSAVIFEIDMDGNLADDSDTTWARFQPFFFAGGQSGNGKPPANEWNRFSINNRDTKFLDAINATRQSHKSYQSINELFLDIDQKVGTGGTPIVLPDTAVFRLVAVHGGLQGWNIEDYVDYIQFTFDTDSGPGLSLKTTRFDFGFPPPPPVADPDGPYRILAGDGVTLDGSGSSDPDGGSIEASPSYSHFIARLYLDIDAPDLKTAWLLLKKVRQKLRRLGAEPYCQFSGRRGFHVIVLLDPPLTLFDLGVSVDLGDLYRKLLYEIGTVGREHGIVMDGQAADMVRCCRLPYTRHELSGLRAVPVLPGDRLSTVLKRAKEPENSLIWPGEAEITPLDVRELAFELLEAMGVSIPPQQRRLELALPLPAKLWAQNLWRKFRLEHAKVLVLHPGCGPPQNQRTWPVQYWRQLAVELASRPQVRNATSRARTSVSAINGIFARSRKVVV